MDKTLTKGCIYYTDNRPRWFILEKCQEQIKNAWKGKLISVSLAPINFGENIVLKDRVRSYPTMLKQIVMALTALDTDVVFFLEHDVLYHPSHFDFWPMHDDIYYYNINNWRWGIMQDYAITSAGFHSLSQLCCNRMLALKHFEARLKYVEDNNWDKARAREPRLGNVMGYEPGTKPTKKGGFSDEKFEVWRSELPNIDIKHRHTFSSSEYSLEDFKDNKGDWKMDKIENIPYWHLKELHDLWLAKYRNKLMRW